MPTTRTTLAWSEPLIFDQSMQGRAAVDWQDPVDGEAALRAALGDDFRPAVEGMPAVSEPQVVRHFTRLSQQNLGIDTAFYPLGSCTMKYNPKVNEIIAGRPTWTSTHPYADPRALQSVLELLRRLEAALGEISGMDAISLQPAAGAQGELTGLLCIAAYHQSRGDRRETILVPDSAHGTNPSTCAMVGYKVKEVPTGPEGYLRAEDVKKALDGRVAGMMITNPNTLGIFEREIGEIAQLLHAAGALLYMDGANLNALMGLVRPGEIGVDVMHFNLHKTFSTPHGGGGPGAGPIGVKRALEPFLPVPRIVERGGMLALDYDRPQSVGRVKAFYGNMGMLVRAYAYIAANGSEGLAKVTRDAILNANYIRAKLKGHYHLPYESPCLHEVVFSDKRQAKKGVNAKSICKALLDYGFHAPTMYFPLVVHGALMIEPTETETRETLDEFIEAMVEIARRAESEPESLQGATQHTFVSQVDETAAARHPVLRWMPGAAA